MLDDVGCVSAVARMVERSSSVYRPAMNFLIGATLGSSEGAALTRKVYDNRALPVGSFPAVTL